ncbi:actin cytoskeleton protein [Pseudomassariella vexata]|uniref:Actin cytoskeleton protein n=1 Tax=Pseudomassariella vexata TaxID=1141098 RepID=A0A1Y2DQ74_9PEZI|nr:actin cytoskeleton protein [Pseudomassariella vexata]ORY61441.1 actin cytoskeleton protein [Pseudomassariella vexata]
MAPIVHVKNIAATTEEKAIKDFFSFCGKITDIKTTTDEKTKEATITFEKDAAARTATLLNNTELEGTQISVTSEETGDEAPSTNPTDRDSDEITQEEKPRSRILAEYLAHGYVIGDAALQRSIELDQTHGVTSRFMTTLQNLDSKYHATDRAKATDQSYGLTQRANLLFSGLSSYFEKATNTPTGQKLVRFYTDGSRQVQDIHTEARRLADLKKESHGGSAYKASGLERVFGKEKPAETSTSTSGAGTTDNTGVSPPGPGAGTTESTPIAPTGHAVPSKEPGSEKV